MQLVFGNNSLNSLGFRNCKTEGQQGEFGLLIGEIILGYGPNLWIILSYGSHPWVSAVQWRHVVGTWAFSGEKAGEERLCDLMCYMV